MPNYCTEELLDEMSREADLALERAAERMARRTVRNMLHMNGDAAAAHGGKEQLLLRLKASYARSLSTLG
ncbi:hypothetical protein ACEUZ9_002818 [Paracoccus litorisediminis]|uniref:hypothetical protein n=1 Tax=Paracoccus litorisediminis TaxID=2006130 RepID=UPI00373000A2